VATGYQSDSAAMTQAVQAFDQAAQQTANTMKTLESELVSLLAAYKGQQATAFWNLHTELQNDMTAAAKELDTLSQLVNKSYHNYGTGDEQVAQSLKGLNGAVSQGGSILNRLS
jgi:uncharacterized protein YukE